MIHGVCLYGRGLLKEAIENLTRGAEFCNRADYFAYGFIAHYYLGEIYHARRDFQEAVGHYEEAIRLRERSELWPSWPTLGKTGLALSKIMNGEQGVDLESLCRDVIKSKPKLWEGWIRRNLGESFLNIDGQHFPEAQHWIEEAIEADRTKRHEMAPGKGHCRCTLNYSNEKAIEKKPESNWAEP